MFITKKSCRYHIYPEKLVFPMNFEKLHSYYKSLRIDKHIEKIAIKGETLFFAENQKIHLTPGYIFFITKGSLSISISGYNLTIGNTIEYMPVGLMERYCPLVTFEYTGVTNVTIIKLNYEDFDQIFLNSGPETAQELAVILTYMVIFTLELHSERKQPTSYQIIKPMLHRYLYRQNTHQEENEGLATFIIRRTNLSRTHVFRLLAELKNGNYITMENGRLISIDKPLPEEY